MPIIPHVDILVIFKIWHVQSSSVRQMVILCNGDFGQLLLYVKCCSTEYNGLSAVPILVEINTCCLVWLCRQYDVFTGAFRKSDGIKALTELGHIRYWRQISQISVNPEQNKGDIFNLPMSSNSSSFSLGSFSNQGEPTIVVPIKCQLQLLFKPNFKGATVLCKFGNGF